MREERPGSIWQWEEILDLIPSCGATTFAIQQCKFGAITPKPTRFLGTFHIDDGRCFLGLPKFDSLGAYKGPLPKSCGHKHQHKLLGKTQNKWNTSGSAAYPPGLCEFLAGLVLHAAASSGRGKKNNGNGLQSSAQDAPLAKGVKTVENIDIFKPQCKVVDLTVDDTTTEQPQPPSGVSGQSGGEQASEVFNLGRCCNFGRPISVEWDGRTHEFIDGFGLCSPARWHPADRGRYRSDRMKQLAQATFEFLRQGVMESISDVRREAFKLVTGKLQVSPFSESCLRKVRERVAGLLPDCKGALVRDLGQPFFLRLLSQWLEMFEDPDFRCLVNDAESFATGVNLGVDIPLPRSPQVFPEKVKHRKLDTTDFNPIAENYPSAQISSDELVQKFREEESLGRMFPSKLGVLKEKYGNRLRVASMAAIAKPDGAPRCDALRDGQPLHQVPRPVAVPRTSRGCVCC